MSTAQQPEALAHAATLEALDMDGVANFVRRQHAKNTTLQQGYAAARLEIESLQRRVQEVGAVARREHGRADRAMRAAQPAGAQQAPAQADPADIIAGALQISRGHAYDLMREAVAQAAPAAVAGCTRSHPHENMDNSCRAKAAIAEMQNMAARGAEATAHDLERFVAMLAAATTAGTEAAKQRQLASKTVEDIAARLEGK